MNRFERRSRVAVCILLLLATANPAWANCDDAFESCSDRADGERERCLSQCERRFDMVFHTDALLACDERCEDRADRTSDACGSDYDQCEEAAEAAASHNAASSSAPKSALHGTRQSGQDGCYFGECPGGGEIESAEPAPEPAPRPRPQPQPTPQPQVHATSICQTSGFWCRMGTRGPVGYQCYCQNPFGFPPFVNGITVSE